jgi:midasin (ATPase involved in ribosome maturation)
MQSFPEVRELAELWFDMASILNKPDVDRSYYKVFRDLWENEISRAKGGINLSIGFRMNMENLGKNVDLMTGTCMSAIWEVARPSAPTTHETWVVYDEIALAIAKFERDAAYHMGIPLFVSCSNSVR